MEAQRAAHSRFGGSIIERVIECPGSVALCDTVPPGPESRYAAEGSHAHAVAAYCLREHVFDARTMVKTSLPMGVDDSGVIITEDLALAVNVYLDAVYAELSQSSDAELYVEHGFELAVGSAEPGEVYGTTDCAIYHPTLQRLAVFDYKHGQGVSVDAEGNKQLMFYAAGALFSNPDWRASDIEVVIVQPRALDADTAGAVKAWTVDVLTLMDFVAQVEKAVGEAKRWGVVPGDGTRAGEHCRWCPAASVCPAREGAFLEAAKLDYATVKDITAESLPDPRTLDAEHIGALLKAFDILDGWAGQVREYAQAMGLQGAIIPGRKMVAAIGRAKWIDEPESIAGYLQLVYGVSDDDLRPRKLVTITEAERLLKAKLAGEAFTAAKNDIRLKFTLKESSGLVMVPVSDRRPAVDAIAADFGNATFNGLESPQ